MTAGGHGPRHVDEGHDRPAEDEPERVGVVGQDDLRDDGEGIGRALRGGSHGERVSTPNSQTPTTKALPSPTSRPNAEPRMARRCTPSQVGSWTLGVPWKLVVGSWRCAASLEVVPDPEVELALPELVAAAAGREDQVFPVLVERRLPHVVDVQREAEQEALDADAVRGPAVLQAPAGDGLRFAVDGYDRDAVVGEREEQNRPFGDGVARLEGVVLLREPSTADVAEDRAADP